MARNQQMRKTESGFTHVVKKSFIVDGRTLAFGDRVDASTWLHTRRLENTRYIAPIGDQSGGEDAIAAK